MNSAKNRRIISIADKVKFLRRQELLSIKETAVNLGLHSERVANLELGVCKADLQDVVRYCDYFGLDYEGFLFDDFVKFKAEYVADEEKMLRAIGYKI